MEELPNRHNRPWSMEETSALKREWLAGGVTISQLASRHQRTRRSIELRLEQVYGLVYVANHGRNPTVKDHPDTIAFYKRINTHQEPSVDTNAKCTEPTARFPLFEMRPYVRGNLASNLSDDAIFNFIREAEEEIKTLEKVENKPEKLVQKIAKLKAEVKELMAYVDKR